MLVLIFNICDSSALYIATVVHDKLNEVNHQRALVVFWIKLRLMRQSDYSISFYQDMPFP